MVAAARGDGPLEWGIQAIRQDRGRVRTALLSVPVYKLCRSIAGDALQVADHLFDDLSCMFAIGCGVHVDPP